MIQQNKKDKPRRPERRTDRLLVVDVAATCWEGDPPPGERSEIVQVGLAWIYTEGLEIPPPGVVRWVTPIASKVSPFCVRLTGITQADVDANGAPLGKVCDEIRDQIFAGADLPWASYGDYDRRQFDRNCREAGARYPFPGRHLNVKAWVAVMLGWPAEVGLKTALERVGLQFEGRAHQAGPDARNVARLLVEGMRRARKLVSGRGV